MFGKKKNTPTVAAVENAETFEHRKQSLIARREEIFAKAQQHANDSKYAAYISACKRFLDAAKSANTLTELIKAERMSNPTYLLPRRQA